MQMRRRLNVATLETCQHFLGDTSSKFKELRLGRRGVSTQCHRNLAVSEERGGMRDYRGLVAAYGCSTVVLNMFHLSSHYSEYFFPFAFLRVRFTHCNCGFSHAPIHTQCASRLETTALRQHVPTVLRDLSTAIQYYVSIF